MGLFNQHTNRFAMASSKDLVWLLIRNNNCRLIKRDGQTFSRDQFNLTNKNSCRLSGIANKRAICVEPGPDGKGVTVITRNSKGGCKLASSTTSVTFKRSSRQNLKSIRNYIKNSSGRKDLLKPALKRASAVMKSQAVRQTKKTQS